MADAVGIHLEIQGALGIAQLGLGDEHHLLFGGGAGNQRSHRGFPDLFRFQIRFQIGIAGGGMDVRGNRAGFAAGFAMGMLSLAAEGFTGHGNARKLQVPEHRQNHHRRQQRDDTVHTAAQTEGQPGAAKIFPGRITQGFVTSFRENGQLRMDN